MDDSKPDSPWIETLERVIDEGVERDEAVELTADRLEVDVPLRFDTDAERARWRFDGTVRVSADGASGPLADWLQFWFRRSREQGRNDGNDSPDPFE